MIMNNMDRIRNTGIIHMIADIIWIMAISIEYPLQLQPPGSGSIIYLDQAMFLPLVIANQEPNQITETVWGLA